MPLTPKETGASGGAAVFPHAINYSALIEAGFSSTGAVATDCTIALGWKPTNAAAPLNDMTAHYALTIRKVGSTVTVWNKGIELDAYGGSIGSTYAALIQNVLTYYAGSYHGCYSRLAVVEQALDYSTFWQVSDLVTELYIPGSLRGLTLHTLLDFSNAADLGEDSSGNGNDWTVAGTQTVDTPTDNYATCNALVADSGVYQTLLTNGNLTGTADGTNRAMGASTLPMTSGKFSWEVEIDNQADQQWHGITDNADNALNIYNGANGNCLEWSFSGSLRVNGVTQPAIATYTTGDVLRFEFDVDSLECELFKGAVSQGTFTLDSQDQFFASFGARQGSGTQWTANFGAIAFNNTPTTGYTALSSANIPDPTILKSASVADIVLREGNNAVDYTAASATSSPAEASHPASNLLDGDSATYWRPSAASGTVTFDFGAGNSEQLDSYTVQARNSSAAYAPSSVVVHGSDDGSSWTEMDSQSFAAWSVSESRSYTCASPGSYRYHRYTFAGGSGWPQVGNLYGHRATTIDSLLFQPDWVNIKSRDTAGRSWQMFDTERGANKTLQTDSTNAEASVSQYLNSFDVNGYTVGTAIQTNASGDSFIDLCLKAGVDQGFEIVTYTGTGTGVVHNVAHNLGKAPTFYMVKRTTGLAANWVVYHKDVDVSKALILNAQYAAETNTAWNSTHPTSTHFTVASTTTNNLGDEYVAYVFTDSDIFKAFSYIGNASADGPFVNLGGRPLAIPFLKNADNAGGNWKNVDAARNPFNNINLFLDPGITDPEGTASYFDFSSVGAKVITGASGAVNGSGQLHVGLAITQSAAKYGNAF